ncbi:MAG: hypothetical protein WD928_00500 [Gammaproteobacteria bacterium]
MIGSRQPRQSSIAALGLALLALLAARPSAADVADTVAALRDEPLSLFDWGLFRLEEDLQSVRRQDQDFIRVFYEPEDQRIVVEGIFLVDKQEIKAVNAQRACFTRHHAIKLTLGVIDTDRIHIAPAADFRLGMKFSHHNSDAWPELPDAAELGAEMLNAVFIKVGIADDPEQFPFLQVMRCDGALLSQEVEYHLPIADDVTPD